MGSFWKGNHLVQTQKWELKGELMVWRTKMEARVQGCDPAQGFNLLQFSPNWFLGTWTLDVHLK